MKKTTIHTLAKIIGTILVLSLFIGCGSISQFSPAKGGKYAYKYTMVYPIESSEMLFQDDSIIIQFKFDEGAIRFQLQNIAESELRILWDKAAISINGQYFPVRHSDNLYTDTSLIAYSMLVPSMGYVRDLVIPRQNVYFNGEEWIEEHLLPTMDKNDPALRNEILSSVGKPITFLLPLEFGSTQRNYEFEFHVADVVQVPWKDYVPQPRVPAPPAVPRKTAALDRVTAAIVTVGVLGFSAYLLTMKKNPPTE